LERDAAAGLLNESLRH